MQVPVQLPLLDTVIIFFLWELCQRIFIAVKGPLNYTAGIRISPGSVKVVQVFELLAKLLVPFFLSVFILTKQLTGLARRPGKSASSGPIAIVRHGNFIFLWDLCQRIFNCF